MKAHIIKEEKKQHINFATLVKLARLDSEYKEVVLFMGGLRDVVYRGIGENSSEAFEKYADYEVESATINYVDEFASDEEDAEKTCIMVFLEKNTSDVDTATVEEISEYIGAEEDATNGYPKDLVFKLRNDFEHWTDEDRMLMRKAGEILDSQECQGISFEDFEGPQVVYYPSIGFESTDDLKQYIEENNI